MILVDSDTDISVNINTFIEIAVLGKNILRIECNEITFWRFEQSGEKYLF